MNTKQKTYIKHMHNILVIEDMTSWQKKFKRFLQDESINIVIATNYLEALILAEIFSFDLLILDVNLSGVPYNVDGLHVADELWCKNKGMKIVIVSGDQDWDRHLSIYDFVPRFIFEKQHLDQDDFVNKIHQALAN